MTTTKKTILVLVDDNFGGCVYKCSRVTERADGSAVLYTLLKGPLNCRADRWMVVG